MGLSVGFLVVTYYNNVFKPKVWDMILHQGQFELPDPLRARNDPLHAILPKIGWISRWALAFYIGGSSGVSIPSTIEGRVLGQMEATIHSLVSLDPARSFGSNLMTSIDATFLVVGTLACLVFFIFSIEHKGGIGRFAYFGRLCIMAGFGASFGYTVMARVSLLIGRIQYLTRDVVEALRSLF